MSDPNQVMIDEISDMLRDFCIKSDSIFVRDEIDGKYGTYSLYELPVKKRRDHEARMIVERIISHINDERR